MRKLVILLILVFILSACGEEAQVYNEDLEKFVVKQALDEERMDDFIFRLTSGKEKYRVGEEVELYGEIIYTGEEPITITHAESAVIFQIKEIVRGYSISVPMAEIGIFAELAPHEPYRQNFSQRKAYYWEEESKEYKKFIENIKEGDGFPPGYYVVDAMTSFYYNDTNWEISAQVDFKVLNE